MSNESSSDLHTKYQKLATEYAKLRSQVAVLKKGVIDEQEKNVQLTDQAHERETHLRKNESEMEGILFRNQQLSRRVNILQEEIDTLQSKSKSRWKSSSGGGEKERHDSAIINEELVAKITENARLHSTLDDIEKQYENTITTLQNRIQDLEREKAALGAEQKNRDKAAVEGEEELRLDNDNLRTRVSLLERDLGVRTKQVESLEVQLEVVCGKNRELEEKSGAAGRADFGAQFSHVDREEERRREETEREVASLSQRLEESLGKMREIERDREHWKLEFQLTQIKLEKIKSEAPAQDSRIEADIEEIMTAREEEIKQAYEDRLAEVVIDRLQSDSKTTAFYLECQALSHKISLLESEKETICEESNRQKEEEARVGEETRTMRVNYEEQLSVMSDHLAEMNSRLAAQEDTIIQLRQTLEESEGKKKGKKG